MRFSPEQPPDPLPCSPTHKQQAFLARHNLHPDDPDDFYEAAYTIGQFIQSRRRLPPTPRQEKLLKEHGKWRDGMTRGKAFDLLNRLLHR